MNSIRAIFFTLSKEGLKADNSELQKPGNLQLHLVVTVKAITPSQHTKFVCNYQLLNREFDPCQLFGNIPELLGYLFIM